MNEQTLECEDTEAETPEPDRENDDLNTARGIFVAAAVSVAFWIGAFLIMLAAGLWRH